MAEFAIQSAKIQAIDKVEIVFDGVCPLNREDIKIGGGVKVAGIKADGNRLILKTSPFDITRNYTVSVRGAGKRALQPDEVLDEFYSEKPLGCTEENGHLVFRLFAPRAIRVVLVISREVFKEDQELGMKRDNDGVWEAFLPLSLKDHYYGFRVQGPEDDTEFFDSSAVIADPYANALATQNHYLHPARSLIVDHSAFDWEGDTGLCPKMEDLIIYEMHVRDMTAHSGSGVSPEMRGTYPGLMEGKNSGINYIRSLGINAVELLPAFEFGNIEIDYKNRDMPDYNTWNPYERNHWGYMTSCYFAPESYYATGGTMQRGAINGADGKAVTEFKEMVKAFHKAGIAVILDVVYNHVSHYDLNPLKLTDKKYYFRLDDDQDLMNLSHCGNDLKTERPMARRLIVDSILFWMKNYHIDGFRFDLATMLDGETLDAITRESRKINPDMILIAEPWGGGQYDLECFSKRGWGAWNDIFRNGVKGQNPNDGLGFIFGKWQGQNNPETMKRAVRGTLKKQGGPFLRAAHSVNYLECHDDYTLGDFIRIGLGDIKEDQKIENRDTHALLSERQLRVHRLGALFLLTSCGPVMIHAGQCFGRSKVIAPAAVPDNKAGVIDHNSYNKDDETNWINYDHKICNAALVDYYRGLIDIRKYFPQLRREKGKILKFLSGNHEFALGYTVKGEGETLAVLMNSHPENQAEFDLPSGKWNVLADAETAGIRILKTGLSGRTVLLPGSGMILIKQRNKRN